MYGGAEVDDKLKCDIGFVGGYWPHKGLIIDKYLFPLLHPMHKYRVKIFGNQPWKVNQYCGVINDADVKNLFVSAKICPNLSEPHAHEFGIDVNERIFKILYSGGFCISDNVDAYKMFGDGIVIADSPEDFENKINHYLDTPEERVAIAKRGRQYVKDNHTGFHRCSTILSECGFKDLSKQVIETARNLK
jgi:spore maturation protein CgeB